MSAQPAERTALNRLVAACALLEAEVNEENVTTVRDACEHWLSVHRAVKWPRTSQFCLAGSDGDCYWPGCPQERDGEPAKSGRHCPIDTRSDS